MFPHFSRRQLLRLVSLLFAGTAATGSIALMSKFFVSKAQAQMTDEQVYKNRTYRIVTQTVDRTPRSVTENGERVETTFDAPVQLFLDSREVRLVRNRQTNKYRTNLLPFTEYNSPEEIAKRLIDLGVQVPTGDVQLNSNVE